MAKGRYKERHNDDDGRRTIYGLEGPLERLCARLLPLMSRLTALNLSIPKAPQLPPFNDLEHLELHSCEIPFTACGQCKPAQNVQHITIDTMSAVNCLQRSPVRCFLLLVPDTGGSLMHS